jgi:ribosomal protein L37AE/L43A
VFGIPRHVAKVVASTIAMTDGLRHTSIVSRTPTQRSSAKALAAATFLTTAALAIVTNYATASTPTWLKSHPAVVWIAAAGLVALGLWLIGYAGKSQEAGDIRSRRLWLGVKRNARLVRCLACDNKALVILAAGAAGAWQCDKCGRKSLVSVDSTARVTVATNGYGKVRYVQRTHLRGFRTMIYQVEVLESPTTARRNDRDVSEPGETVISHSVDGMFKREFRKTFIRGLLRDRRMRIVGWSIPCAFLVPLGSAHSPLQLAWHVAVGFAICLVIGAGQLALRGWNTFSGWVKSADAIYCWLQHSEGIALAVLVASGDEWQIVALRVLGGKSAQELSMELMQNVCQYADRNRLTLAINTSDPDRLIGELHFAKSKEQWRRGYSTLIRQPSVPQEKAKKNGSKRR